MTEPSPARGAALPRHVRLMMRLSRRDLRDLPPPECAVRVDAGLAVPAADGVALRTDHYIPQVCSPRPTVLVRTPVRPRLPLGPPVRRPDRRAGVPRRDPELPGDRRVRRGVPAVPARGGRRPGHRGLAARAGLVHRGAGHDRPELPELRPVGAGRRPAPRTARDGVAERGVRSVLIRLSRRRLRPGERARGHRRHAGLRARDGRADPDRAAGAAADAPGRPGNSR